MSLINQMLQDLDKRRASTHERDVLPLHVRVLPEPEGSRMVWYIAVASGVVVLATALAWQLMRHPTTVRTDVAQPQERLVSAPPVNPPAALPRVEDLIAAPPPVSEVSQPIPSTAVIARDAPPVAKPAEAPALPAPEIKPPPVATAELPRAREPAAKRAEPRPEIPAAGDGQIDKRTPQLTPQQTAEIDYRDGSNLLHQGRAVEAQQKFRLALQHYPAHPGARQALLGLLIEAKRPAEAEQLLQEGLSVNANQPGFAMALARMQVDRGDTSAAIETLQKSAPAAGGRADYIAFLAALFQRQSRHVEAVDHYQTAVSIAPRSGVWLMGLGISLQALNRTAEAREAYRRALATASLTPELQAFVSERLRQLS